ncbi:MAG TPA: CDP-diacylglycerol--serine O-phosphatidyltransferase [Balneolales bacterium]|nr:CDP-diacylglycerol--serine O-phosphatidyltransferase [Balneolales bacterium]
MKYRITRPNKKIRHHKPRIPRKRRPLPRVMIPSFFTLMNLFCGFVAIIQIYKGNLVPGSWLIVFAGLFDALDGLMARLTNATSAFGIELDSLSDIVSFGVAPGFLVFRFGVESLSTAGIIIAALPALCGAIRLARFNVETRELKLDHFRGLPIPAQATMLVAFYLTFNDDLYLFDHFKYGVNNVLVPMVILLSLLMVSTVPFDKIPRFSRHYIRQNRGKILLFVGYLIAIILFREYGLMAVFTVFIGKGLVMAAIRFSHDVMNNGGGDEGEEEIVIIDDYLDEHRYRR